MRRQTIGDLALISNLALQFDKAVQGNRASEAFDECSQEVIAPSCLFELHAV
jgi:hypothetical protein